MSIFESHAHYDDRRFDADRDALLRSLPPNGVSHVVNVGDSMASSKRCISLAWEYDFVSAAVGVHPHNVKDMAPKDLAALEGMCRLPGVVAVGEIGLDYYYDNSPREAQRHWFKKQLELARRVDKPVIIHSRDAARETFDIIKESGARRGVIHCYSGSAEMALEYAKLGFYIGVGGVITYKNAKQLRQAAAAVTADRILLETDCPYLSPEPKRSERNTSLNLKYVISALAAVLGLTDRQIQDITERNGMDLFLM